MDVGRKGWMGRTREEGKERKGGKEMLVVAGQLSFELTFPSFDCKPSPTNPFEREEQGENLLDRFRDDCG